MDAPSEEREYLNIEAVVRLDTPLGLNRLTEYKNTNLWTSMVIRQEGTIVGGQIALQEQDHGVIEDVFLYLNRGGSAALPSTCLPKL